MSGYLNGFGPINAHPAPESSQTSGLSMGKRLSGQIRSHGYQSHGRAEVIGGMGTRQELWDRNCR